MDLPLEDMPFQSVKLVAVLPPRWQHSAVLPLQTSSAAAPAAGLGSALDCVVARGRGMQERPLRLCLPLRQETEALDRQSYGLQRKCHCVKVLEGGLGEAMEQSAAKCCFDWPGGIGRP